MFQIVRPAPLWSIFQNKASDLLNEGGAILAKPMSTDKRKLTKKHNLRFKRSKKGQSHTIPLKNKERRLCFSLYFCFVG
ncbi:hypothetical protein BIY22_10910 [Vibrio panuliri]|uniref:Uncharacterized protein n=1 Tax=Vibrio panuliri TaxID=1381081 RepID=A0A1Q9HCG6_9VIBR|nr:hypothetical protein F7O85_20970 [Vibrio panuliri]OLQ87077.1 hypothetical protein BIY22_10910 [Vibrio panuliri]OLQ95896.1 hypothetical protein BIY20_05995 [Vibrio panuliri]